MRCQFCGHDAAHHAADGPQQCLLEGCECPGYAPVELAGPAGPTPETLTEVFRHEMERLTAAQRDEQDRRAVYAVAGRLYAQRTAEHLTTATDMAACATDAVELWDSVVVRFPPYAPRPVV